MSRTATLLSIWFLAAAALADPPQVDYLSPPGGQRGQTVKLLPKATAKSWPAEAVCEPPDLQITAGITAGEFLVQIPPDAVPGVRLVRLVNDAGASNLLPFVVGTLAEIEESEPNDEPRQAHSIDRSEVVVNGRLAKAGDVDVFAVALRRGQTLAAQVDAHRLLGSPMDGVLQMLSTDGFVLEQANDSPGLDPRLAFTAPRDGTYLVRLLAYPSTPDASINLGGGERFVYRLTLTTGGLVDYAFPLAVSRSDGADGTASKARLELCGWNIPPALATVEQAIPPNSDTLTVFRPELAGWAEVAIVRTPAAAEQEPNDAGRPQPLTMPVVVSGRIGSPGDVDVFTFPAEKGQPVAITLASQRLGFELTGLLKITDSGGRVLARQENPPAKRDLELTFAPPQTGAYRVAVEDLCGRGGNRHAYRLDIGPPAPSYELAVKADQWTIAAGQTLEIPVTVDRRQGFNEEIEVVCVGLPDDAECPAVISAAKGDSAKQIQLKVTAGATPFRGPLELVGKSTGKLALERAARYALPESGLPVSRFWLTITGK